MIDLDELLTGAAGRLDDATSHLAIPDAPRPSRPVGRIVAIGACAAAAVGGVIVVRARDHHTLRPAQDPPGLHDGTYGSEITLTEVPDGDDDPTTWKLVASPAGGEVIATRPSTSATAMAATTMAGTVPPGAATPDTTFADAAPSGADPALCIFASSGGGTCSGAADELTLLLGVRGDDGQALAVGVPAGAAAVAFQSGDTRYWTRPVHGVALFPYPASASLDATITVLDTLGGALATRSDRGFILTDAEVAAAVVTEGTGQRIAGGWYTSLDITTSYGGITVRLEGRTGQSGFGGPFTAQSFDIDGSGTSLLVVLTVATTDVGEVTDRLTADERGRVRRTIAEPDGVTVLIWATDTVSDTIIGSAVAGLTTTNPQPDLTTSLDAPRSFYSAQSIALVHQPGIDELVTEVVSATDGTRLRVARDDLGDVNATLVDGQGETVAAGPHAYLPARLPEVGDSLWTLTAVPSDVTSLTVTLDDGTTLDLPLADLRPYADAKVAIAPTSLNDRRLVTAVDAR